MPEPKARLRGVRTAIRDLVVIAGAIALTNGVYSLNQSAGWIAGGILAMAWGAYDIWASD